MIISLLLAKISNFGKYVRLTVCLFVTCQNFQFCQVCSSDGLLLAKIFNFGKYVRLTVCMCVCAFVRNFFDTGHSF